MTKTLRLVFVSLTIGLFLTACASAPVQTAAPEPAAPTQKAPPPPAAAPIPAQTWTGELNSSAIMMEAQRQTTTHQKVIVVQWVPIEAWQAMMKQNPNIQKELLEQMVKKLEPYLFFWVVAADLGPIGGLTYKDENYLRANLELIDDRGQGYLALEDDQISPDVRMFNSMIKPVMQNLLGPLGKNMYVLVFPAKARDGRAIADPRQEGSFSVRLADDTFNWRMPLGTVLPPKTCPTCKQPMSGAWKFCPWDATPLK